MHRKVVKVSMIITTLNIFEGMSDVEIRRFAKKEFFNGGYFTWICRRCGIYYCSPDGNTDDCDIVDECKHCFTTAWVFGVD